MSSRNIPSVVARQKTASSTVARRSKTRSITDNLEESIEESTQSFKECHIKNSARRNSLQKKMMLIERERKISSSQLDKKEKVLREKYQQLQADQKVCSSSQCLQDAESKEREEENLKLEQQKEAQVKRLQLGRGEDDVVVNPYPITFRPKTVCVDKKLRKKSSAESAYAPSLCRRRMSNEFEDLILNTRTGGLQLPGPKTRKLPLTPMIPPRKISQSLRPVIGDTTTKREDVSIRRIRKWSAQE